MIYLHKLLPIALSPIGLILGLMLWAAFKRYRAAAFHVPHATKYCSSKPALW